MNSTKLPRMLAVLMGFLLSAGVLRGEVRSLKTAEDFRSLRKQGIVVVGFGLDGNSKTAKQMDLLLQAQKALWEAEVKAFKSKNKGLYEADPSKAKSMEPNKPFEVYEVHYSPETRGFFSEYQISKLPSLVVMQNGNIKQTFAGLQQPEAIIEAVQAKMYVWNLNDANFENTVKEGFVFVDFWAPWCGPCLRIAPHVKALAKELEGVVRFYKLNTDNNKTSTKKYVKQGIPTLVLFKDGKPIETLIGYRSLEELRKEVKAKLP